MDGRTKDGEMGGFKCLCVCARVRVRVRDPACVRVTLCAKME